MIKTHQIRLAVTLFIILGSGIFSFIIRFPFLLQSVEAEEVSPGFTLQQLLQEALANNPELKAVRARWEAAKFRIGTARSLDDPMIGADLEGIPRGTADFGQYADIEYMISQAVPFPGKLSLKGKIAQQEAKMVYETYRSTEQRVVADVKSAFETLYLADRSIEVLDHHQTVVEQFSKTAEVRYTSGAATQQDILKAHVELAKMTNALLSLQQERQTAAARLNSLLNRSINTPLEIRAEEARTPLPTEWDALSTFALSHQPDLRAMELEVEKQKSSKSLAKMGYLPDFFTRVEARQFSGESSLREYDTFLGINLPIWFWGKQRSEVKEKQAMVQEAQEAYTTMKNKVLLEVKEALVKVQTKERLVQLYQTAVLPQAEETLRASQIGYETGKIDFLNLLDSDRSLRDFELEYYAAVSDYNIALAQLERSMGGDSSVPEK